MTVESDSAWPNAAKKETEGDGPRPDDPFAAFLSDLSSSSAPETLFVPKASSGLLVKESEEERTRRLIAHFEVDQIDVKWGSGTEEVDRILELRFRSSTPSFFEIFRLPPHATEALIKKHFRKLSILIHPDKCSHAKATDAFHLVTLAYDELLKPEQRARYTDVIEEAREMIIRERKNMNKKRVELGEQPLPLNDDAIRVDTILKCEAIIKEREERLAYAEKTRWENANREERLKMEEEAEQYQKELGRKRWVEQRDDRVASWRDYREDVAAKRARLGGEACVASNDQQSKSGLDETYKRSWR